MISYITYIIMEKCKTVIFAMSLDLAFQLDSLLKKNSFTAIT